MLSGLMVVREETKLFIFPSQKDVFLRSKTTCDFQKVCKMMTITFFNSWSINWRLDI